MLTRRLGTPMATIDEARRRRIWLGSWLILVLGLSSGGGLLADRVTLKDGNVFEGKIIRVTDRELTLRGKIGVMTFPLRQISTVRERDRTWSPTAPSANRSSRRDGADANVTANVDASPKSGLASILDTHLTEPSLKDSFATRMEELETNELESWKFVELELATGPVDKRYRLKRIDGSMEFAAELPADGGDYASAWVRRHKVENDQPVFEDERPVFTWVPLFWHANDTGWFETHPNEAVFRWEQSQVETLLERLIATASRETQTRFGNALRIAHSSDADSKERAEAAGELSRLAPLIAGRRGAESLLQVYELNARIEAATEPSRKVALARLRRDLLRQLVERLPER